MKKPIFEKSDIKLLGSKTFSVIDGYRTIESMKGYFIGLLAMNHSKLVILEKIAKLKDDKGKAIEESGIERMKKYLGEIVSSLSNVERTAITKAALKKDKITAKDIESLGIDKKQNHSEKGVNPVLAKFYALAHLLFFVLKFNLKGKLNQTELALFNPFCFESKDDGKIVLEVCKKFVNAKTLTEFLYQARKHKFSATQKKAVVLNNSSIEEHYKNLSDNNSPKILEEPMQFTRAVSRYLTDKKKGYGSTYNKVMDGAKDAIKAGKEKESLIKFGKEFIVKHKQSDKDYFKTLAMALDIVIPEKADKTKFVSLLKREDNAIALATRLKDKDDSIHAVLDELKGAK